jgi:ABC-type amino acid transport system permease subunit
MIELDALACRALLVGNAIASRLLARKTLGLGQRAVARTLGLFAAADIGRGLLSIALAGEPRPYVGLHRVAFLLHWTLLLAFPALSAALAIRLYLHRSGAFLGLPWAALGLLLALLYPSVRGEPLVIAYAICHVVSLLVQLAAIGIFATRRGWPGQAETAGLILSAGDLAALAGPLVSRNPWWTGRWATSIVYAALLVEQLRRLARARSFSPSSRR